MTVPFTYIITHIPTNVKYYGARYAENCHPNDLGTIYFSSSKTLKSLIQYEGIENFPFEVRRIFKTKEETLLWEHKFLMKVKAAQSPYWFNKNNGGKTFTWPKGQPKSEQTKQRMRKPKSPEHRSKLKAHLDEKRVIPVWTDEKKQKLSKRMTGKGNHNFGKSDHPGAITFQSIAKSRKGKTREEIFGKEKADEMKLKCRGLGPRNLKLVLCPHCGREGKGGNMSRYHFDNCKIMLQSH